MGRIRTVFAVAKKDLIQITRYPTWIIPLFIWPLITPFFYILTGMGMAGPDGSGMDNFNRAAGTKNFFGYVVIGSIVWMWANSVMWTFGSYLRDEQMRGTLESNWLCPIKRFDILIGGAVVSFVESFIMIVISILEYRFIYGINFTGNILTWMIILIAMIPGVYGFGTIFAGVVLWAKEASAAIQLIRGIITVFCGITFPIVFLPGWMRSVANILPFTYGINAARKVMINGMSINTAYDDITNCFLIGVILMILGRICFTRIESRVRRYGSLERF